MLLGVDPFLRSVIVICAIAAIVLVSQAIGSIAGGAVRRRMGNGVVGGVDTGAGAAFGLVRGLFLVWLMGGLAAALPMAGVATEARQSAIVRALDSRLPSPTILAAQLGQLIEATGLPEVFVGAPPPADIPAGGPTQDEANQIAAAARGATLKVEAIACGNFVSGTAFAVSKDHFVTNAHVVAGSTDAWLSFDGSLDRYDARVVFFDPDQDIAVLDVDAELNVTPLTLSTALPERGADGAALGYSGGGRLQVIPALISRPIDALGRDIYGNTIISRTVIEMKVGCRARRQRRPGRAGRRLGWRRDLLAVAHGAAGGLCAVAHGCRRGRGHGRSTRRRKSRPEPASPSLDQAAAAGERVGRERRDAHRHERPLRRAAAAGRSTGTARLARRRGARACSCPPR